MNLPNKITISRIVLSIIILVFLVMPWSEVGIKFKEILLVGKIVVNIKYIIAGVLFIIAAFTDFIDGYLARSKNMVTDFGKAIDAIADKILVNGVLIILANQGFISVLVPVIIIMRDIFVDSLKMVSASKGKVIGASILGKIKTICMLIGISLMLFYNLPFEIIGIPLADILIIGACILSVISGCQYYFSIKPLLLENEKE